MPGKFFFTLKYWLNNPPWDTGITPPEVYQFLEENSPGKALDLGCGTGTNAINMAEHGWHVTGIDYVPKAIRIARHKARRKGYQNEVKFMIGDVLAPGIFQESYDLILDIGCFHSFSGVEINRYVENVFQHLAPGASLLLYVHLNELPGSGHGAKEESLAKLKKKLTLIKRIDGDEYSRPSAWLQYRKE
ncbi:MAG: class I SAM-dependent methyltransferase [Anaerolineales bacterium]|nr:class I SAM-dependent methyltransferase [Anaerolineales bacterium]